MNKLTKVGISALAGSLAMVNANAVEFALTGDAMVKYVSAEGNEAASAASNGKGLGVDNDLYVNASGELDNGWTVAVFAAINLEATTTSNESSVQTTVGMGSLGTITFNDVWGVPSYIDDMAGAISAYEEPWDSTTHTRMVDSFGADTQSGSISYSTPSFDFGGATISGTATFDPNAGAGPAGPGSSGGTLPSGSAFTVAVAMGGLTVGAGTETSNSPLVGVDVQDEKNTTAYALYKNGPIGFVYQVDYKDETSNSATNGTDYEAETWGVSFAQGDWAISWVEQTEKKHAVGATAAGKDVEMEAFTASYTMGAMSIKGGFFETANPEWTTGAYEETEIALSFAF